MVLLEQAARALSLQALGQLGLTPREAEVLHGLARGEDPETVATELEVSPRTVAKHVQHIHAKLGVSSRAQAVATAWAAASGTVLGSPSTAMLQHHRASLDHFLPGGDCHRHLQPVTPGEELLPALLSRTAMVFERPGFTVAVARPDRQLLALLLRPGDPRLAGRLPGN